MNDIVGNFTFDCPTKAYDLSSTTWMTDEVKADFDRWFEIPHEEPAKAPSDEEFFAKLMSPHSKSTNENTVNGTDNNNNASNRLRKRSIGEVHATTGSSLSKPVRNTSIASTSASSALGRPAKVLRPNLAPSSSTTISSSSASSSSTSSLGVARATQSSTLRATSTTAALSARAGSAPKTRPIATTNTLQTVENTKASTSNLRQVIPQQQAANKVRSTSAGKIRVAPPSTNSAIQAKPVLRKPAVAAPADDSSLEKLLRAHNSKFVPVPAYEPPKHSVRDVRKWEKLTGKLWCELTPEERQVTNEEITRLKDTNEFN